MRASPFYAARRRRRLLLGSASPEFNAFWHADFWVDGFWVDNFWAES